MLDLFLCVQQGKWSVRCVQAKSRTSKATAAMAEQKAEIDSSAPFASVKAAVSMFGDRIPIKSSGSPAHASHSHHHHPPTFSANNHGYVGHQAPHLFPQNAEVLLL
jgi:hypothetical protein